MVLADPSPDELDVTAGGSPRLPRLDVRPQYAPGTAIGRYVVLGEVGAGAMGVVLATFDPELNRKVALKLLVPTTGRKTAMPPATRLLREAQAIARLSHPNVVSVYDVGRHGDAVFMAMEFVEGQSVTQWLAHCPRAQAEILAVFASAGRGLAAAHAASLVHRDFKPDNVVVSPDGRVRVLDFGLARADPARYESSFESDLLEPEAGVPVAHAWSDSDVLNTSLTRDDAVVGTPRYMAPEQHAGEGPDARSDQYSFCVALYQALYGQYPFGGSSLRELAESKQAGRIAPTPTGSVVPLWLEETVRRGLCPRPGDRWPTMDALVARLERDPTSSRRRWAAGIAAAAGLGAVMAAVGYERGTAERPCQGGAQQLAEVWNANKRVAVADAILRPELPFSLHTQAEVQRLLDRYATSWIEAHRSACEATRVRGEQSDELLDLRMTCLKRRKEALRTFVDVVSLADDAVIAKAVEAASALPDIAGCADVERLRAQVAPPADDASRRVVTSIEGRLDQARVLQTAGKTNDALALAQDALRAAEAVDYAPLRAAAQDRVGVLLESTGDYPGAESKLHDAYFIALRAGDDERAASAATGLTSVIGDRLARYDEGLLWGEQALALLDRAGVVGLPRARVINNLGNVRYRKGDLAESRAHYLQALAIREEIGGPQDPALGLELINLGNVQLAEHDYDAALATFRRSQSIIAGALGAEHPNVMFAVVSIGVVFQEQRRFAEAHEQFAAALPMMVRALGEDHPFVATAALNLGNALHELGRSDEALVQLDRADAIYRQTVGAEHPNVAAVAHARGMVWIARADWTAARASLSEALRIRQANFGEANLDVAATRLELSRLDQRQGDAAAAVEGIREVIATFDRVGAPLDVRANAHGALADALWEAGQPGEVARREAELALDLLRGLGPRGDVERETWRAWLRKHRAASPPAPAPTPAD